MHDHLLAQSILDRLGYNLQDLSLEYGDVVIPDGDISHQLWYDSIDNSCNIMGYVWIENDLYYVSGGVGNHTTPECAALELLDPKVVAAYAVAIEAERDLQKEYV
jgi:hypothetical protein